MRHALCFVSFLLAGACATAADALTTIDSDPPGASVFINGRLAGATPLKFDKAPAGEYLLRFEKDGFTPLTRKMSVTAAGCDVREKLKIQETGALIVEYLPKGAEVLLDGELAGHTPLSLDKVPAGSYELVVRKPKYESYTRQITLTPGDKLVFRGEELTDKVEVKLRSLVNSEPQHVGHYVDLAFYLFASGKKDGCVEMFRQAVAASRKPLNFDGPGFAGRNNMTGEEVDAEQEQRQRDVKRMMGEMEHPRYAEIRGDLYRARAEQ